MEAQPINIGDTVRVLTRARGEKKAHDTVFEGVLIGRSGHAQEKTITVRKMSIGKVAVERIFPLLSPSIVGIKLVKKGKVRRAKLYYLRKIK